MRANTKRADSSLPPAREPTPRLFGSRIDQDSSSCFVSNGNDEASPISMLNRPVTPSFEGGEVYHTLNSFNLSHTCDASVNATSAFERKIYEMVNSNRQKL